MIICSQLWLHAIVKIDCHFLQIKLIFIACLLLMLEYIGDGSAPYVSRVSIDEARRRENVNPDNEDNILMGNGSAPRETTWKGQYHDLHFLNLLNFLYGYCDTFREEIFK